MVTCLFHYISRKPVKMFRGNLRFRETLFEKHCLIYTLTYWALSKGSTVLRLCLKTDKQKTSEMQRFNEIRNSGQCPKKDERF